MKSIIALDHELNITFNFDMTYWPRGWFFKKKEQIEK